ncbi:AzlC family ABC transporter permease [Ligilactobacillus salivarius]|uniref:AzlC family ABC transporter permease n=1 Tax=Ligilactobacillus salivarius TaxID=1624 RepID=UPI003F984CF6
MNAELNRKTAIKEVLPTAFGYIGIGIAFGIVSKAAGLSALQAAFLVNSRMILMSLVTAKYFKNDSMLHNILIGSLLTDESFALAMNKLNYTNNKLNFAWFDTANWFAYFVWFFSSVLGALVGNFIENPTNLGIDFALVAMFIGLLYLQMISDKSLKLSLQLLVVVATFILVYLGLIFIPSNLLIIIITLLGCAVGMVLKHVFF